MLQQLQGALGSLAGQVQESLDNVTASLQVG